ncbi:MAG: phosphate ABC transporter permease subunit PstC [Nostocales cyanobacterium]|nr:MAG: phosphate ABC transporter permease subunit PstC [Nostocales cyanobacterium]TAF18880.1 MAG: phosphate ABC transporter permease subunit PstC [Nostocales cyanobacterium]
MTNSFEPNHHENSHNFNLGENSIDLTSQGGINFRIDQGFKLVVYLFSGITVAVLLLMTWVIFKEAQPAVKVFGLGFLWSSNWDVAEQSFGALPYIYGTLVSSAIAMTLTVPIGISVALVTSEDFLPPMVRNTIAFVIELIAAIPSVIIGLWGIFIFIPIIEPLEIWLGKTFKFIPLFGTEYPAGNNMLTAGIILSIMILPTMSAISRDVLMVVPKELRSASMALGSTRWETIFRVLLPAGFSGIVSASMLALGRALGETMAVTMVIGNYAQISVSLLDPAYTIPAVLANEFAEAEPGLHIGALSYLGLILFALTLAVNIGAVLLVQWVGKKNS